MEIRFQSAIDKDSTKKFLLEKRCAKSFLEINFCELGEQLKAACALC